MKQFLSRFSWKRLLPWLAVVLLALAALFLNFCMVGYSFSVLVCCVLMGIIVFYTVSAGLKTRWPKSMQWLRRIFTGILCIGILVVGVTEALVIEASFGDPEESCDYVVVLGAMVREDGPAPSLQDRIVAAYDYLTAHPDVIAVVSGGQGPDESVSEAQCMYDELTRMGIAPERIWMEDKATSTWENLQFTLNLIEDRTGIRPTKLGIISSEYHMLRAGIFADAAGIESVGIPAETSVFSQKINHFMREVAGIWHYIILGGQYHD